MSYAVAATRNVDVRHRGESIELDEWGNGVQQPETVVTYRATREQLTNEEDVISREHQAKTFRYMFPAKAVIASGDRLFDHFDGKLLDVVGSPNDLRNGYGKLDHWEVIAEFTEG